MKKLEKHYTVYTIDLLGCGRSDKPYLTYTNYLYVQLLTDFIHDVIGERPDVVTTGNSISFAVLAQNMNPNLLASITAINPPAMSSFDRTPDKYSSVKKTLLELPILGTISGGHCRKHILADRSLYPARCLMPTMRHRTWERATENI